MHQLTLIPRKLTYMWVEKDENAHAVAHVCACSRGRDMSIKQEALCGLVFLSAAECMKAVKQKVW